METPAPHLYDPAPAQRLIRRHRELAYPHRCRFGGVELVIDRDVFCPALTNTSSLLMEQVEVPRGTTVLDVFSGSGVFGIWSALHGAARVVCLDTSSAAVFCASRNARLNGVSDRIDVRCGSIETGMRARERFDVVIANPPLLPGCVTDTLSAALFDPELAATHELLQRLPDRLASRGVAYLLTSDVFERAGHDLLGLAAAAGLSAEAIASRDVGYEQYRVHRLRATDGPR